MKLLFHPACGDLFALFGGELKYCRCGQVAGRHLDDRVVEVVGEEAVVLGAPTSALETAYRRWLSLDGAQSTTAALFVLPFVTDKVKRVQLAEVAEGGA